MPISRFYFWRNALTAVTILGAIWETFVFFLTLGFIAGVADYYYKFSIQTSADILILEIVLSAAFLTALLLRARKKIQNAASTMEQYLGMRPGELTAVLEFQQRGAAVNESAELSQAAISNADQSLKAGRLDKWLMSQLPLLRWIIELIAVVVFLTAVFLAFNSKIAAQRLLNPGCTDSDWDSPDIESFTIRVIPPAATMTGAFDISRYEDAVVPAGSTVRFTVTIANAVDYMQASIQIINNNDNSQETIPLELVPNTIDAYKTERRWVNSAQYRIVVDYQLATRNSQLATDYHTIDVTPDEAPKAELTACQTPDMEVVADALIPLEIRSSDDYGVVSTSVRWRILKPEEIQTGVKPAKIVYQRQPVWDAFQDESIKRPPKERTETTALNLSTMELQPGAQLDVMAQAVDTLMEEGDSALLRLKVVTAEELNKILVAARIRIGSELRRALDTLSKAKNESNPAAAAGLYDEFARQTWGEKDGVRGQLAALVERVKMNHAPWGRTLVDLESAGRRLEKLQSQYHDEITRLFSILNLDASDRNAQSRLKELIQKLSEELTLAADSFGQWRQYRELCESFKEIRHAVLSLEKQIRNGMTPEAIETVAAVVPQTAVQTQTWLAQASESSAAYEQTESQPQAAKWSAALQQTVKVLDAPLLRPVYAQALETNNAVSAGAAIVHLREIYDRAWAILSASGDDAAQKRLELKAEVEQIYDQQKTLNEATKSIQKEIDNIETAPLANRQQELANRVGALDAPNMTVVTDTLLQTRAYMVQAAEFIQQGQSAENIAVCQNEATERLEQILDTLNEAEQLAILAMNRANESEDAQPDSADNPDDDKPHSKVSIEDLKLLELQQRQVLEQTCQAYADALDAGSMTLSEESAAVLADRQQRLASLTWFLTTVTVSPELLRGERPKEADSADSLDDALLGDLTAEVEENLTDAQKAEREQKRKEQEFLDTVWNELGTAAVSEEDAPLLEIVRLMRQTYELFKLRDAGEINQGLQEQICDHFISFINQLSFSRSKQKDDKSKAPESGDKKPDDQNEDADDEKTVDASAPGAGEKTSDGESQQLSGDQAEALKRRIWGELPPEIQQAFPIDTKPIPLPGYREKINRYWKELEK
ncbi:MAG: hypothetical protein IJH67_13185 [Thermoguttaceae bacterium]|nr:hypothetical protein [Thermoguttaceae bacterium]